MNHHTSQTDTPRILRCAMRDGETINQAFRRLRRAHPGRSIFLTLPPSVGRRPVRPDQSQAIAA